MFTQAWTPTTHNNTALKAYLTSEGDAKIEELCLIARTHQFAIFIFTADVHAERHAERASLIQPIAASVFTRLSYTTNPRSSQNWRNSVVWLRERSKHFARNKGRRLFLANWRLTHTFITQLRRAFTSLQVHQFRQHTRMNLKYVVQNCI